jgi:hypothetical protein
MSVTTICQTNVVNSSAGESAIARLSTLCDGADSLSLAVGYLFLEGLAPLIPALKKLSRVQLLIGNVVNRLTEEQILEEQEARGEQRMGEPDEMFARGLRVERDRIALETALNLRRTIEAMPHTEVNRALLIDFATLIAQGTVVVRLLTKGRLHAKLACISYPETHAKTPGAAIVGTSNLTLAIGLGAKKDHSQWSADLDVQVDGKENLAFLNAWFGAHWVEAQDFQKELFDELVQSWPLRTSAR